MKFQQKARVSVERVISGPGIATIYEFLTQKYPEQVCLSFVQGIRKGNMAVSWF